MPGFRRRDGSGTSTRARNVPVFGSTVGLMREIVPVKRSPPSASTHDLGRLLRRELAEFLLRDVHVGDQRIEVGHAERGRVRRDRVADLDVARRHHAVDRRADLGVAQLEAGAVVGRAQRVEVELGVLRGALGDQALLAQFELALVVALELAQVGLGLRHLEPQAVAVEPRQHLAGLAPRRLPRRRSGGPRRRPWRRPRLPRAPRSGAVPE